MALRNGDSGNNTLVGTDDADIIRGRGGNDTLTDGGGSDQVFGGAGNDTIFNLGGSDSFFGGKGVDTLVSDVTGLPADYTLLFDATAGEHGRRESSPFPNDTIGGIENFTMIGDWDGFIVGNRAANVLITDAGDDVLRGMGGNDVLRAGAGDDRLIGGGGRDRLVAGKGQDDLFGGGGNDRLQGGGGADELVGGRGRDVLFGGAGRDVFKFKRGDEVDRIKDFENGRDLIEIGRGASDFDDVTISRSGDNAIVEFANVRIIVEDTRPGQLTADDFLF